MPCMNEIANHPITTHQERLRAKPHYKYLSVHCFTCYSELMFGLA